MRVYKRLGLLLGLLGLILFFCVFVRRPKMCFTCEKRLSYKIWFVTYGNDAFIKSRIRIIKEAKVLHIFDYIILETDKTIADDTEFKTCLNDPEFEKVYNQPRGGGYWIWKPYIVYKTLQKMEMGDILVFCDAGCVIPFNHDTKQQLENSFDDLRRGTYHMKLNEYGDNEKTWSKGDVLKYYNVYDDDKILDKAHLESGRIILIKNQNTMNIINKWWTVAKNRPHLFDDSPSSVSNKQEYREHRNDQSHISILCNLNDQCIGSNLNFIHPQRRRE